VAGQLAGAERQDQGQERQEQEQGKQEQEQAYRSRSGKDRRQEHEIPVLLPAAPAPVFPAAYLPAARFSER